MSFEPVVNITHTTMQNNHIPGQSTFAYESGFSPDVFVNDAKVVIHDTVTSHVHSGVKQKVVATSASVFVNDKKIARKNDPLTCNSVLLLSSSSNVFSA